MPIDNPPVVETLTDDSKTTVIHWPRPWVNWFNQILRSVFGWKLSYMGSLAFDFGSISGGAEASTTVTITGVAAGDSVFVTPSANTAGIIYQSVATAVDTVTLYAKNFTSGSINPALTTFSFIVFQQGT
jgi:hypothetical protein